MKKVIMKIVKGEIVYETVGFEGDACELDPRVNTLDNLVSIETKEMKTDTEFEKN